MTSDGMRFAISNDIADFPEAVGPKRRSAMGFCETSISAPA